MIADCHTVFAFAAVIKNGINAAAASNINAGGSANEATTPKIDIRQIFKNKLC